MEYAQKESNIKGGIYFCEKEFVGLISIIEKHTQLFSYLKVGSNNTLPPSYYQFADCAKVVCNLLFEPTGEQKCTNRRVKVIKHSKATSNEVYCINRKRRTINNLGVDWWSGRRRREPTRKE